MVVYVVWAEYLNLPFSEYLLQIDKIGSFSILQHFFSLSAQPPVHRANHAKSVDKGALNVADNAPHSLNLSGTLSLPCLCTYHLTNQKPEQKLLLGPISIRAGQAWLLS